MANLEFRYGSGKSADLCETAYNYNEKDKEVIVINGDNNKDIVSKYSLNGESLLRRNVDIELSSGSLFDQVYLESMKRKISCVLVDNCQFLSEKDAEDLFFIANLLDIRVIAYGNRMLAGNIYSVGSMRLMELSNIIKEIDQEYFKISRTKGARLEFHYGAMNSSKTAKLLFKTRELEKAGLNVILMKPSQDRDAVMISSRIGMKEKADIVVSDSTKLYCEGEYFVREHVNYVLVDEAQFFTVDQIEQLRRIVDDYNIPIRCYGLKIDFLSRHFTGSGRLLEISDGLEQLDTQCECDKDAIFNARINSNGEYQKAGEVISIDNGSNYVSLCPDCYIKNVMSDNIPKVLKKVR